MDKGHIAAHTANAAALGRKAAWDRVEIRSQNQVWQVVLVPLEGESCGEWCVHKGNSSQVAHDVGTFYAIRLLVPFRIAW